MLDRLARQAGCNLLFVPGGTYSGTFRPFVTMSRNLLPFDQKEARRYGLSWMFFKLQLLRRTQAMSMKRADGVIFLTEHARRVVMEALKQIGGQSTVIPHGVNQMFDCAPRVQQPLEAYSHDNPFRFLYVSIVTVYKHQWHIAEAVARLRAKGMPVQLELVGSAYGPALDRLKATLDKLDPEGEFLHYRGPVPHRELAQEYQRADAFLFASTCETFGQIVTEAMGAGLPIASSDTGTMRELLGENALYFDPEQPEQIAKTLEKMLQEPTLRTQIAQRAHSDVQCLTWERCANETFSFITKVAQEWSSHHLNG